MHSFSVYKRKKDKRRKDTKWLVAWTTATGKRKAKTAFTDYQASVELGRKLARQAAMEALGEVDQFERHRNTPVEKHLEEFIDGLRSANRAARYVLQVENRIRRILDGLGIERLCDLDPVTVDRFLTDLARRENLSGITRNEYVTSIKSFTKWAVTFRRMQNDLLAGLRVTERRAIEPAHPRQPLGMQEIARLFGHLIAAREQRAVVALPERPVGRKAEPGDWVRVRYGRR